MSLVHLDLTVPAIHNLFFCLSQYSNPCIVVSVRDAALLYVFRFVFLYSFVYLSTVHCPTPHHLFVSQPYCERLDAGLDIDCLVVTILLVSLSLMLVALCMQQVNQRTTTIELAERANKHFLLQFQNEP